MTHKVIPKWVLTTDQKQKSMTARCRWRRSGTYSRWICMPFCCRKYKIRLLHFPEFPIYRRRDLSCSLMRYAEKTMPGYITQVCRLFYGCGGCRIWQVIPDQLYRGGFLLPEWAFGGRGRDGLQYFRNLFLWERIFWHWPDEAFYW